MSIIKCEGLTKYYGKYRGIENVNFSVDEGDFYGFIGPNGAGKSTTIRTLLGLISATSGSAQIFGLDIASNRTEILSMIGYLPSENMFYKGLRVSEILSLSAKLRNKDCSEEAKILCERLELDTTKKIEELSFGNRKKVGIVCAMQHKPSLYILDEPTSGLDPLMQSEFYNILKERNEKGATVFLSSHILSEVGRYCKKAAVIREGKILVSDSVEKLGHTGVKRVSVKGISDIPKALNAKIIKNENENIQFLYNGDISLLIKEISNFRLQDINITDPELDEVFMHFYTKEDE